MFGRLELFVKNEDTLVFLFMIHVNFFLFSVYAKRCNLFKFSNNVARIFELFDYRRMSLSPLFSEYDMGHILRQSTR